VSASDYDYIGCCRACGGVVMLIADKSDHKQSVARNVADAIRQGYYIERVTTEWIQSSDEFRWCKCGEERAEAEQMAMF
jgi:hypothetical protein